MSHDKLTDELREQLSLYALEMLEKDEAGDVSRHLSEGCTVCEAELGEIRQTMSAFAVGTATERPPDTVRRRVLAATEPPAASQVWKGWNDAPDECMVVVRKDEGEWETVAPGVTARRLYVDHHRDAVTMMVRMSPGANYVPHRHAGPEQCFVLEGDLWEGDDVFRAGDFQCASKGSVHGVQRTETGCLLLIVSSLHDQLLA